MINSDIRYLLIFTKYSTQLDKTIYYAARQRSVVGGKYFILTIIQPPNYPIIGLKEKSIKNEKESRIKYLSSIFSSINSYGIKLDPSLFFEIGNYKKLIPKFIKDKQIDYILITSNPSIFDPGVIIRYIIDSNNQIGIPIILLPSSMNIKKTDVFFRDRL